MYCFNETLMNFNETTMIQTEHFSGWLANKPVQQLFLKTLDLVDCA